MGRVERVRFATGARKAFSAAVFDRVEQRERARGGVAVIFCRFFLWVFSAEGAGLLESSGSSCTQVCDNGISMHPAVGDSCAACSSSESTSIGILSCSLEGHQSCGINKSLSPSEAEFGHLNKSPLQSSASSTSSLVLSAGFT